MVDREHEGNESDAGAPIVRDRRFSIDRTFLAVGTFWVMLHAAGRLGPVGEASFGLVGVASIVAILLGLRRNGVRSRRPWHLVVLAFVVWSVAGGLREQYETLGDLSSTRSLLPDAFSLTGYSLLFVGIITMMRHRYGSREASIDAALDSVIITLAAAALAWVALITPALHDVDASPAAETLLLVYPALSMLVVTMLCRIGFTARTSSIPAYRAIMVAVALLVVGDVVYMLVELDVWAPSAGIRDLPYAGAMVVFATGALHPSSREIANRVASQAVPITRWRVTLVGVALVVPAGVTIFMDSDRLADRIALGAISAGLVGAAVVRIIRALSAQAAVQDRLAHAAAHDDLTGLPNRVQLQTHLGEALRSALAGGQLVAVLFLDIDQFKVVNDGLGHRVGDGLLASVARRIQAAVGERSLAARVGGDEFVVVSLADDPGPILELAEKIRGSFALPFAIERSEVRVSVSIGVNLIAPDAPMSDWGTIIEDADAALFEAKRAGRDQVVVFDRTMRTQVARRLSLEQELRKALGAGDLTVAYQPLVSLPDGRCEGFEALVRWEHAELGTIGPAEFIPVAEETGMIRELGIKVLETALAQLADWRREGFAHGMKMSVNVSPRQMADDHLVALVPRLLALHGLSPVDLQLEITEGLLVNDTGIARSMLDGFRDTGILIALDDFGTGYSSLGHLKRFPVDVVKIDRSFVTHVGAVPRTSDESLVTAIVAMASALGLTTLAEGVETTVQAARLFEMGVVSAQGYHFARPMSPDDVFARFAPKVST